MSLFEFRSRVIGPSPGLKNGVGNEEVHAADFVHAVCDDRKCRERPNLDWGQEIERL